MDDPCRECGEREFAEDTPRPFLYLCLYCGTVRKACDGCSEVWVKVAPPYFSEELILCKRCIAHDAKALSDLAPLDIPEVA